MANLPAKIEKTWKEEFNDFVKSSENSIWLVVYKTPIEGRLHAKEESTGGRFFKANSIEEALNKFAAWANSENLNTYDIYAIDVREIAEKQFTIEKEDLEALEYEDE